MTAHNDIRLDNPVWHSITESDETFSFSGNNDTIRLYNPDYCPFGGLSDSNDPTVVHDLTHVNSLTDVADLNDFNNNQDVIEAYASHLNSFFIVGQKPILPETLKIQSELVCLQMVATGRISIEKRDEIVQLTTADHEALIELVNLVQPGFFKDKTPFMGDYFGIFKEDKLIAITGERMKMNGFTELSAIITHPEHTGKGYAKQLIAQVADHVYDQQRTPFLHVTETNVGAIGLYEKMGFKTRRKMSFWYITK